MIDKEKYEELLEAASELASYASYALTVGGISVNEDPIRKWSDKIYEINKKNEL